MRHVVGKKAKRQRRADALGVVSCRWCRARVLAAGLASHQRATACRITREGIEHERQLRAKFAKYEKRRAKLRERGYAHVSVPAFAPTFLRYLDPVWVKLPEDNAAREAWLPGWQMDLAPFLRYLNPRRVRAVLRVCKRPKARAALCALVALDGAVPYEGTQAWLEANTLVFAARE